MKILFFNGSPNPNGNTADLAKILLKGKDYSLFDGEWKLVQFSFTALVYPSEK